MLFIPLNSMSFFMPFREPIGLSAVAQDDRIKRARSIYLSIRSFSNLEISFAVTDSMPSSPL